MKLPDKVNILGVDYSILYCESASEVDCLKREALWGQMDPWTRTIRIFNDGRSLDDTAQSILHETVHAIAQGLRIERLTAPEAEDDIDRLAVGLADMLIRNNWWKLEE